MHTVYCPRCDKPFSDKSRVIALAVMREHLKKHKPEDGLPIQEMLDATRE